MKPHREPEELRTGGPMQRKMVLEDMKVSRWIVSPVPPLGTYKCAGHDKMLLASFHRNSGVNGRSSTTAEPRTACSGWSSVC
ncbi:hypothetical protein [Paenibacillus naphthalenovorans]|uniref:hypothetical protein n=1 Tax=Paenibacillus naphthalenovorans TaxID=162209 RepID=UPI0010F6A3E3|nr:hypothetical protein [Paenibacillus naphthalenovorans]